jgi:ferric-dicitrate binding protein FerR (iron transport regulator)
VGKMWAKVSKKQGTDFQVTTPTSVASVKGTSFGLEEKPFPETHLWVLADQVLFTNGIQTIVVNQGQHAVSTSDSMNVDNIGDAGCDLVDQGEHKIRIQFEDSSGNSKDLVIEFEK